MARKLRELTKLTLEIINANFEDPRVFINTVLLSVVIFVTSLRYSTFN